MEKKQIVVIVNGHTRIIRKKYIDYQTEDDLECTYKGYSITVNRQETGGFYVKAFNSEITFGMAVDGFFGQFRDPKIKTIEDCVAMCIENILWKFQNPDA